MYSQRSDKILDRKHEHYFEFFLKCQQSIVIALGTVILLRNASDNNPLSS
jgi:hypothetical protein